MMLLRRGDAAAWFPREEQGCPLADPPAATSPGASLGRASSAKSQLLLMVTNIRSSEGACP
jgi:hypothetical protein